MRRSGGGSHADKGVRNAATVVSLVVMLLVAGCVTETVQRKPVGTPAQRVQGGTLAKPAGGNASGSAGAAVAMPAGPVAAPAKADQTVESRVVVGVRPIGVVPFDSMTLPLVSPDGRRLATQVGETPSWATVLAAPGAEVPRTTVRVFDLTVSPPRAMEWAASEPGLMLGRDADDRGVLVESVRADASRWIGRLLWDTGEIEWLARDTRVSAHGVLGPAGELVFTRREADGGPASLVIFTPGGGAGGDGDAAGVETALKPPLEKSSFSFPCVSPSGSTVMVFMSSPLGTEVRVYPMGVIGSVLSASPPIARRQLAGSNDPMLAYQCVASSQPARLVVSAVGGGSAGGETFLLHHPAMGRMAMFDAATGLLTPLAERSIAAAFDAPTGGYFLTTPRGLVHQRLMDGATGPSALPEARVLSESWVARPSSNPAAPYVLIGPGPKNQSGTLQITAMEVVRQ